MRRLLIATKNAHKAAEIRAILGEAWDVVDLTQFPEIPAPAETGATFEANAKIKAEAAARDDPARAPGRTMRSGGRALVDQLDLHGVEIAFCVPGESYLPVLDALHDSPIRLISCRHEAAAANMADESAVAGAGF